MDACIPLGSIINGLLYPWLKDGSVIGRWGTFLMNGCMFYEWTGAYMINGLAYA